MAWRYASASVRGSSHIKSGTRRQDAVWCFDQAGGNDILVSIVSDGAGSATHGGEGASIVCRTLGVLAREGLKATPQLPSDEAVWSWVDTARDRIHLAAERRQLVARDFAATLVLLIATPTEILTAHVGDGGIVGRDCDTATWLSLSSPHNGEYASTTFFLTDEPQPTLRIGRHENRFDALAAFSDGVEILGLDNASGSPSGAFFGPMTRPLEKSDDPGRDRNLSLRLATFLQSARVTDRTDDDTTLVVARVL